MCDATECACSEACHQYLHVFSVIAVKPHEFVAFAHLKLSDFVIAVELFRACSHKSLSASSRVSKAFKFWRRGLVPAHTVGRDPERLAETVNKHMWCEYRRKHSSCGSIAHSIAGSSARSCRTTSTFALEIHLCRTTRKFQYCMCV